ncbi:MAG: hypothetical protein JSR58_03125 [Verrucomicrobia bacterium]|nr:hypothetical protein [Verrucomicrobiota bacterium]
MIHSTFFQAQRVVQLAQDNVWEARVLSLKLIPVQTFYCALDLIAAAGSVVSLIATGAVDVEVVAFTCRHYAMGVKVIAYPFVDLLRAINPQAPFVFEPSQENVLKDEEQFLKTFPADRVFTWVDPYIQQGIKEKRLEKVRLLYVALAIALIVIRCLEMIVSPFAVGLSILSKGKWEIVNTVAFCTLQAMPNMVFETAGCFIKLLNPHAVSFRDIISNSGSGSPTSN